MMMKKVIALTAAVILFLTSCSSATLDNAGKELEDTITDVIDAEDEHVLMVKGGYREDNPDLTYEEAFTSFFGTPRWKYFKGTEGQDVVEFTGDCIYRDAEVKARIQFILDVENQTFEATYLAFNEVPQDNFTLISLISKVFEEAAANKPSSGNPEPSAPSVSAPEQSSSDGGLKDYPTGEDTSSKGILFCGYPIEEVIGMHYTDLLATFGEDYSNWCDDCIQYGMYDDDEWRLNHGWVDFNLWGDGEHVSLLKTDPCNLTFNGQSLALDFDTLVATLGEDYIYQGDTRTTVAIGWYYNGYEVSFELPRIVEGSDSGIAHSVSISKVT